MKTIKACIDRIVDPGQALGVRLTGLKAKFWPEDSRRLHVRFLGGDPTVQRKVVETALVWEEYAGVEFLFDNHPRAQIRIAFDPDGSWSYIGTDILRIDQSQPTMNFGWLTDKSSDEEVRRVVLHEFGHVLGMVHEHQNPAKGIPWDKEAVYRHYAGPPNYWTRQQIDDNLFRRYDRDEANFSEFDPYSTMLYPVPNEFTIGDFEIGWNDGLSAMDKAKIAEIYPRVRIR